MLIRESGPFRSLCDELRRTERFALDTEFVGERAYRPRLGIIQLAWPDGDAVIDAVAIPDLSPLADVIADPSVEKVLHAAGQDLEILYWRTGKVPARIFDTQIAAGFAGMGERIGYAALVEQLLGVALEKSETFTDWLRRPLTSAQLEYALDDVRHLLPVRERLVEALAARGRLAWAEEEMRRYEDAAAYDRDPEEEYLRVRRAWSLDRRALGILREVAAWREDEAAEEDRARGSVLSDEAMLEIARRAPTKTGALAGIRGVHPKLADRSGPDIIAAIKKGLSLAEEDLPPQIESPERDPALEAIAGLLGAWIRARSMDAEIAAGLIANASDLQDFARAHASGRAPEHRLLAGWRGEVVGRDLLDLLDGRARLSIDPATRRIALDRAP
ncbi:MAG: ribonuclease D [Planctomycetes bacterium]|nr:ribonuclease D [Planctomycetota bacterium]